MRARRPGEALANSGSTVVGSSTTPGASRLRPIRPIRRSFLPAASPGPSTTSGVSQRPPAPGRPLSPRPSTTRTSGNMTAVADLIALGAGETFSPRGSILIRNGGVVTVLGIFVDVAAGGALNSASAASLLVLNEGVGVTPATFGGLLHVVASSVVNAPPVPATVSLAGPLAMITGSTLTTTSDLVGVSNG